MHLPLVTFIIIQNVILPNDCENGKLLVAVYDFHAISLI